MAQESCKAAYPNLEADLRGLGDKLNAHPIPATATRPEITVKALRALWDDRNKAHPPGHRRVSAEDPDRMVEGHVDDLGSLQGGRLRPKPSAAAIAGAFAGKVDRTRTGRRLRHCAAGRTTEALDKSLDQPDVASVLNTTHPPEASGLEARLDASCPRSPRTLDRNGCWRRQGLHPVRAEAPTREALVDWVSANVPETNSPRCCR